MLLSVEVNSKCSSILHLQKPTKMEVDSSSEEDSEEESSDEEPQKKKVNS